MNAPAPKPAIHQPSENTMQATTTTPAATAESFSRVIMTRENYASARRIARQSTISGEARERLVAAVWRLHRESCPYGGEFPVGTWSDMAARSGRSVAWLKRRGTKRAAAYAVWTEWAGENA